VSLRARQVPRVGNQQGLPIVVTEVQHGAVDTATLTPESPLLREVRRILVASPMKAAKPDPPSCSEPDEARVRHEAMGLARASVRLLPRPARRCRRVDSVVLKSPLVAKCLSTRRALGRKRVRRLSIDDTAISPPGADGSRQVRHNVGGSLVVFRVLLSQVRNDSRYEFCQSTAFRRRCAGFEFVERRPECNA